MEITVKQLEECRRISHHLSIKLLKLSLAKIFNIPSQRIDLINLRSAPPLLSFLISQQGQLLAGSTEDDDVFYRLSIMRHLDAKPLYEAAEHYVHSSA